MIRTLYLLPPSTKLGQGYIFTGVCHSVNREGAWSRGVSALGGVCLQGVPGPGGVCSRGCLLRGGLLPGGPGLGGCLVETPPTVTAADITHPTGMHSCFIYLPQKWEKFLFGFVSIGLKFFSKKIFMENSIEMWVTLLFEWSLPDFDKEIHAPSEHLSTPMSEIQSSFSEVWAKCRWFTPLTGNPESTTPRGHSSS